MQPIVIPELGRLSKPEKILFLEDLWDSIASDQTAVPVPESRKEELDRRLRRYDSHPRALLSLEELMTRLESRKV